MGRLITETTTTEGLAEKIANLRQRFAVRLEGMRGTLEAEKRPSMQAHLTSKIEDVERAAQIFNAVVDNLPPCLELRLMPVTEAGKRVRRTTEDEYRRHAKPAFYKHVAEDDAGQTALRDMGLSDADIKAMAKYKKVPHANDKTWKWDLSIEHLRDMRWGGSNDFSNLCVIPRYVNGLKTDFTRAQEKARGPRENIVTFIPTPVNGQIPLVPRIKGGFAMVTPEGEKTYTADRTNLFLGVTFF